MATTDNFRNIFSRQSIEDYFVYPNIIRDYSLSSISIVKFNLGDDGKINEIEIVKYLGQPFDEVILTGLDTFTSQRIIQSKISKGF